MKKIALICKEGYPAELSATISEILHTHGAELTDRAAEAELVLSLGGDGTFLNAAAAVGASGTPILGINTGHLGFLADLLPEEVEEYLPKALRGEYIVQPRTLLQVEADGEELEHVPFALNEVAILKHDNSALIQIETRINGQLLNGYLADGLIIATPTGSTGYSLSVGGPILSPDSGCVCISAVAPHSLSVRPVILRDDVDIELRIHSRSHHYLLAVDGRSQSLCETTSLHIRRAPYPINVVKLQRPEFFDTLRDKMHWGIDAR